MPTEYGPAIQARIEGLDVPQVLAENRFREALGVPNDILTKIAWTLEGSSQYNAAVQAMHDWIGQNWTKGPDGVLYGPDGKTLPPLH